MSNYATEKELNDANGIDTSDLAIKKYFIVSRAEVNKLDINKLGNVLTSFNNLKTKVYDLDIGKLKKLGDVVDTELVKNTKFNTLKKKVSNLEKKVTSSSMLQQR